MNRDCLWKTLALALACAAWVALAACSKSSHATPAANDVTADNAAKMVTDGRQTFRFDTFGDESFWGDTLKLHQAVEGTAFGGVGAGLSPRNALALGLKVDVDALPSSLVNQLQAGTLNLDDPANTLALLKQNAVLGVTGFFNDNGSLRSIGIQCALCHSTVDDSVTSGIGRRLDGWANRDLNIGAIIALAPDLSVVANLLGVDQAAVRTVLNGWGPGKFDAELFVDGKTAKPGGGPGSSATLIPPAFGLAGVNLHTWLGWGSVTHWNAFVAVLEMHGKGTFYDPRLDNAAKFPIAAREGFGHIQQSSPANDLVTPKLASLHVYQLAIPAPTPPASNFDAAAATRGAALFTGKGKCSTCHVPPLYTEPGWNLHTPAEIGLNTPDGTFQATRGPEDRYRTAPLKGLWTHTKGGFYHDGRFATLTDVVNHYNTDLPAPLGPLGLTPSEVSDLVEYLKSI